MVAKRLDSLESKSLSSGLDDCIRLLNHSFGPGPEPSIVAVPGRVNLIGEHIDYHQLPVLPMAIQRQIRIAFRPRQDGTIRAVSQQFGEREFDWNQAIQPSPFGDWVNYVKAAAGAIDTKWNAGVGIDAAVVSDLPPAAGLSSSSALLAAFTLALLEANGIHPSFEQLMAVLPEGEYFVGTRGGGMDHAAVLRAEPGAALLIHFNPLSATPIPIPGDWGFLVAHSLVTAEKSGAVRAEYNARRTAGARALERLGLLSYSEAVRRHTFEELKLVAADNLDDDELRFFLHVTGEAFRVGSAVTALRDADADAFGQLLNASHESLRYLLRVSCPALDELAQAACEAGAFGARLTGAGFGGCIVIACYETDRESIAGELVRNFYSKRHGFDQDRHLIWAQPSAGALYA